jgi:hypothetical protein
MFAIDVRWRAYDHEKLINRDEASFWLRDEGLEEFDNLPIPAFSPKKSWKTSEPPSNSSAKSRAI